MFRTICHTGSRPVFPDMTAENANQDGFIEILHTLNTVYIKKSYRTNHLPFLPTRKNNQNKVKTIKFNDT